MITEKEQLKNFLLEQLKSGASEASLRAVLKQEGGWTDADLDEVVLSARNEMVLQTQEQNSVVENVLQATAPIPTEQSVISSNYTGQRGFSQNTNGVIGGQSVPTSKFSKKFLLPGIVVFSICVFGAVGYAFVQYSGVFSKAPYTEENLLRGLLTSTASIHSATYKIEGSIAMGEREAGAHPFVLKEDSSRGLREQAYKRDYDRLNDVERILSMLDYPIGYGEFGEEEFSSSLSSVISEYEEEYSIRTENDTHDTLYDPATDAMYAYKTIQNGADFELQVTFETEEALSAIRDTYSFNAETTRVTGKTVTFTKGSGGYFYMPKDLPKPFLVELSEQSRMLPPELKAELSIEATSDIQEGVNANWSFALDTMVDFGDMSYKVAADARKVEDNYYVRVRNIPGLFLGFIGIKKDVWMKISPKEMAKDDSVGYSYLGSLAEELPMMEEEYKKNRKEAADFFEKVITFAEEAQVIQLRSEPSLEKVGERNLYRYDITLNFDALAPFLRKVIQEAENNTTMSQSGIFTDTAFLEYLESDECRQMFEYIDANTSFVIHVDQNGQLAQVQHTMRLIPPDTAVQLAEKQGNFKTIFSLDNINEKVDIQEPENSVPMEQIMKEAEENLDFSYQTDWPEMKFLSAQVMNIWEIFLPE